MKDYSNYNNQINMMEWSAKKLFEVQLAGDEGETVNIDNQINVRVIIQEHTNPLNELKEDRKIIIPNNISFKRGSVVTWGAEKWLIVNDVSPSDDNGVYIKAKMVRAFNKLRWIDKNTNNIIEYPCIATAQLLYTLGVSENKQMTTLDGRMNLTVTWDDLTSNIYVGMRFIFNSYKVFKVTYIDSITQPKLLNIMLEEDTILQPYDDLSNNLAYNGLVDTNPPVSPDMKIQITSDNNSDELRVNYEHTYTAKVYQDGNELAYAVTWSITDENNNSTTSASIDATGNTVKLKGLIADNYVKLTATMNANNSVKESKIIFISSGW